MHRGLLLERGTERTNYIPAGGGWVQQCSSGWVGIEVGVVGSRRLREDLITSGRALIIVGPMPEEIHVVYYLRENKDSLHPG